MGRPEDLSNQRKHGISFRKASFVFLDPFSVSVPDNTVEGEERWQTFGLVDGVLLLAVVHTDRGEEEDVIRIISARRATRTEGRRYERENRKA